MLKHIVDVAFSRPDRHLVESLAEFPTALLGDAMGRFGIMTSSIRPVWAQARAAGTALTVQAYPYDNLMLHVALYHARRGDMIVVDAGASDGGGLWGEIMTLDAQRVGVAGLVVDGAVRDTEELRMAEFPVWSRSVSPRGTQKNVVGSVGSTISCGGQSVAPGDVIIADADGVAVVPQGLAVSLLEVVSERFHAEEKLKARLRAGDRLYNLLGLEESERLWQGPSKS